VDDFGRHLGCLLYGLLGLAAGGILVAVVLACLILAGVLLWPAISRGTMPRCMTCCTPRSGRSGS